MLEYGTVFVLTAGRRGHDPEAQVHAGGDGARPDGTQPVQRETNGAAGGCPLD